MADGRSADQGERNFLAEEFVEFVVRSDPGPRITVPFVDHANISAYSHRQIIGVTAKFFESKRIVSGILQERLQFGARHRFVDDLLPAIIIHLRKLTQLVEDGPSLCLRKLRQLVDDLGCTHVSSIIRSRPFVSADLGKLEARNWEMGAESSPRRVRPNGGQGAREGLVMSGEEEEV